MHLAVAMLSAAALMASGAVSTGLRTRAGQGSASEPGLVYNPTKYVFLDGSQGTDRPSCGTGPGTAACKSAAATKAAVRALAGTMSHTACGPVVVKVAPGTYGAVSMNSSDPGVNAPELPVVDGSGPRTVAFALGQDDSGLDGENCRVVWEASTAGEVSFSGGLAVSGWTAQGNGKWVAPLPAGASWPQTMRVNDMPATLARHPNAPPVTDLDADYNAQFARVAHAEYINPVPLHTTVSVTAAPVVGGAAFPPGIGVNDTVSAMIWPVWSWINMWAYGTVQVPADQAQYGSSRATNSTLEAGGPSMTVAVDCGSCKMPTSGHNDGIISSTVETGNRIILTNHSAFVDAAGEFYANATHVVYLARPGQDMATAEVYVSSGIGAVVALQGASNISFVGIGFRDTEWIARGFQGGFNMDASATGSPNDGAVVLAGSSGINFEGCSFRGLGGGGIVLSESSTDMVVSSSLFEDVGQSGVMLIGNGTEQPRGITVANNTMDRIGTILSSAGGVYITTGSDVQVIGNSISNCSRWGVALRSNSGTALSSNALIQGNTIRRTGLHTRDFGGISTIDSSSGHNTGVRIEGNCVRDTIGTDTDVQTGQLNRPFYGWGVYLDNNSSNTHVRGNVVVNSSRSALFYHDGVNNSATNNIFAYGMQNPGTSATLSVFLVNAHPGVSESNNGFSTNVVYAPTPRNVSVVNVNRGLKGPAAYLTPALVHSNVYFSPTFPTNVSSRPAFDNGNFSHWQGMGFDANSSIADPQFVDPAGYNWAMEPGSPAVAQGFEQQGMILEC